MRDNTLSMDAALADGTLLHFGRGAARPCPGEFERPSDKICFATCSISASAKPQRSPRDFQKCSARVGGYNLDALVPRNAPNNMGASAGGLRGVRSPSPRRSN